MLDAPNLTREKPRCRREAMLDGGHAGVRRRRKEEVALALLARVRRHRREEPAPRGPTARRSKEAVPLTGPRRAARAARRCEEAMEGGTHATCAARRSEEAVMPPAFLTQSAPCYSPERGGAGGRRRQREEVTRGLLHGALGNGRRPEVGGQRRFPWRRGTGPARRGWGTGPA